MRKILIAVLCINILYLTNFTSYNTANAEGFADIPGYVDETVKTVFTTIAVAVTGASHAKENFEDNVRVVYDSMISAYNTWAPTYKEEFINGVMAIDGELTIAGNYLEDLLGDYILSHIDTGGLGPEALKFDSTSYNTITIPKNYSITISLNGETRSYTNNGTREDDTVRFTEDSGYITFLYRTGTAGGGFLNVKLTTKQLNDLRNGGYGATGVAGFMAVTTAIGASVSLKDTTSNTVVSLENPPIDLGIKEFYDRALNTGMTLGIPQTAPLAENGLPLTLGVDGLYLPDGSLYDGPINWRLENNLTDAGTLVLPDIVVNGIPHTLVNVNGVPTLINNVTGVPVAPNDVIANDGTITSTMPELVYVDGVPYYKTVNNILINVITGEVVGNPPITGETETGDTTGLWSKLWEFLNSILNILKNILAAVIALPLKLLDLLKALLLALFVPSDGFWDGNMNDLKEIIWSDEMDNMIDGFEGLGDGSSGGFKSFVVSLMGVDGLTVIDAQWVNSILDTIHSWVRGVFYPFLLIFNINSLYKLIRGTSLVEATRGLANRNKGAD